MMTPEFSLGVVLSEDVRRERSISSIAVAFITSCAKDFLAISDDPFGVSSSATLDGEVGAFAGTRHRDLISAIAASVMKIFPQIFS
jgi:hypothetical protein